MSDKGYSLTRETVMELAFKTVDKSGRKNLFQGGGVVVKLDGRGLKGLGGATLRYLCAHHSLFPIVELYLKISQPSTTSLES